MHFLKSGSWLSLIFEVAGASTVVAGIALWSLPVALVVAGAFLLAAGLILDV